MTNWIYNEDGTIEPHSVHWKKKLSSTSYRKWDNRTKEYKYVKCGSEEHKKILSNKGVSQKVCSAPIQVPKSISDKWYLTEEWKLCRKEYLRNYYKFNEKRVCNCCGKCEDEVKMNVDHIYPIRRYWSMRLDHINLQNLCEICNTMKGNSMDDTIAKRRLIKKDGKWVILEVKQEPFVCPDWLMDDTPFNWKEEKSQPQKLKIISIKKSECEFK
jgi:5-methylcytosine-specific restriction endonuclease McrA